MLRHHEFDVAEMSLSSYVVSLFADDPPFIAIPVFPSRFFRHSCIYVNAAAGIDAPQDLIGRTRRHAGIPDDGARLDPRNSRRRARRAGRRASTYATGGLEEPGRSEKLALDSAARASASRRIGPDQTLSAMLATGEIDALYTARAPSSFRAGDGRVRRLFEDFPAVERDYFRRTRHLPDHAHGRDPPRHLRDASLDRPVALQGVRAAQRDAYEDLAQTAALKTMLPWLTAHVEETRREMGDDFWPYGLARNGDTLATFLRYSHEQGLSRRAAVARASSSRPKRSSPSRSEGLARRQSTASRRCRPRRPRPSPRRSDRDDAGRLHHGAGADVEHALVEVALDAVAVDEAFRERPRTVRAGVVGDMELAVEIEDRDRQAVRFDLERLAAGDVRRRCTAVSSTAHPASCPTPRQPIDAPPIPMVASREKFTASQYTESSALIGQTIAAGGGPCSGKNRTTC